MHKALILPVLVAAGAAIAVVPSGCTSSNPVAAGDGGAEGGVVEGGGGDSGPAGGPVSGAQDTHCGTTVQATSAASCHPDAGPPDDAGGGGDGGTEETRFNAESDDDDCKYHLSWTSTPVRENTDVTFTVTATNKTDKSALTPPAGYAGDPIRAEVFLNETHPAPNSGEKGAMTSPGTYTAGPIHFDKPGRWTVRFHFFEDCDDTVEDSPHGHAAFYVDVP
jgi:hypothetical protein